ncbi:hypothetical protein CYMTET_50925 [Cymbomonas tetramitiformis]|uniref:Uncharacterized protein n=1 Tax=Cymbomonas tetramitiformis TaxID=36881 RepID=A0AAE0EU98_9CHLO|nr:hypothetical protein CYMTET_50925 [Cymbomonas tetramitiformis]
MEADATVHGEAEALCAKLAFIEKKAHWCERGGDGTIVSRVSRVPKPKQMQVGDALPLAELPPCEVPLQNGDFEIVAKAERTHTARAGGTGKQFGGALRGPSSTPMPPCLHPETPSCGSHAAPVDPPGMQRHQAPGEIHPSEANEWADRLSREKDGWHVNRRWFEWAERVRGMGTLWTASRPRRGQLGHPPWSLLDEVAHKPRGERCVGVVVAPNLPGQIWVQQREALADEVVIMPRSGQLLTPTQLGGSGLLGASSSDGVMFHISASR